MKDVSKEHLALVLTWCREELDAVEIVSDHTREHGGHESSTRRLQIPTGYCYLKIHTSGSHWLSEVFGYEHWAPTFGNRAPRLLAVRDEQPLALVVSELPGQILENAHLDRGKERSAWKSAGAALVSLHEYGNGSHFGQPNRDGSFPDDAHTNAVEYISRRFKEQVARCVDAGYLTETELATIHAAYNLIPSYEGERPVACHRDYCAANWLVAADGTWSGVIDFEFAHWDVRVADFSRDPEWNWMVRPDLVDAFYKGYGQRPTGLQEQQLLVAYTEYAVGAILWGHYNAFYGFEQEGRNALARLALTMA